ncbi:hypothetical protein X975_13904, partial [Stegodyphus mimosarum]
MGRRCFVLNCTTRAKVGTEKVSLFRAPRDPVLFERWRLAVPFKGRCLAITDLICEKHFEKRFILPRWQKSVTNGDFVSDHFRPKLIPQAVPSIFPGVSQNKCANIFSVNNKCENKAVTNATNSLLMVKNAADHRLMDLTNTFIGEIEVNDSDSVQICYKCLTGDCLTHIVFNSY